MMKTFYRNGRNRMVMAWVDLVASMRAWLVLGAMLTHRGNHRRKNGGVGCFSRHGCWFGPGRKQPRDGGLSVIAEAVSFWPMRA